MQFNYGQEVAINAGVEHILMKKSGPLEISGKAGTGKSVVAREILRRSGVPMNRIAPMAYIGQAAIIMRLKGFPTAKTCHSWLYDVEYDRAYTKENAPVMNQYLGAQEKGMRFVKKDLSKVVDAIFVDEGGTIPMSMKADIEAFDKPIIVTGDINQLPPVADNPAYMYDPKRIIYLDQVMRQQGNSSILYLADRALNGLPIHHGYYGDSIVIYEDELTDDMILQSDMVLCGTNATRDRLNTIIREEILHQKGTFPNYGEKVICRKNDWSLSVDGIGLGNGLTGRVINQPEILDFNGDCFRIDFMPDLFNGVFYDLDVNYKFFITKCVDKKDLNKRYLEGHCFEFAYCITTHLAQGAEYNQCIYFEEFSSPTIQDRLNYTGITRAANKLIYVKKKRKIFSFN